MQVKTQHTNNLLIPQPLQPGDLLRVIAPSGALREIEALQRGVEIWRSRGYRVEVIPEIEDRWGYLAGNDENRRNHLASAWKDPECRGILCARGGFGTTRILEEWTWMLQSQETPSAPNSKMVNRLLRYHSFIVESLQSWNFWGSCTCYDHFSGRTNLVNTKII